MRSCRSAVAAAVLTSLAIAGCSSDNNAPPPAPAPTPLPAPTPGDTFGLTSTNRLVTFNRATPAVRTAVAITGLQASEQLFGIDVRPQDGALLALGSSGRIYAIDPASGVATQKSQLLADSTDPTNPFAALDGTDFGVDFNPVVDRLRVVSDTGQNLRINVDSGATFTDGALNSGGVTRTGVTAAAYTNSFAAACRTTLLFIDTSADRLLITSDPNAGTITEVGALGVNADAGSGYDIVTAADGTNTAFAVLTASGATSFYSINLTTGAASAAGAITGLNAGETLRGVAAASTPAAAPAQAEGSVLAVTESNKLISFQNATPQKLCTTTAITGLQASENILGIDKRPADGALYALGSTGRIYTIDSATAAATMKSMLVADSTDATDPFTALDGGDFGVDFNPVPDRLRVVSSTGQNLRINVDSGATTTDTGLSGAAGATAAAYTNSFAGAGTTTLYVFDVINDRLMIQGQPSGNPNNGDLQAVGPLGIDVQAAIGFDISGVNNTAVAALTPVGATTSELHVINLASGAATRVNAIGGGERVRALTLNANPRATLIGLTTDNRLVTFKTATPGTLDTNVAVTGLQGGETIVGFDVRPANNRLYAVTDAGRLYTVDPTTGVATMAALLSADSTDSTNPFTTVSGAAFGVDFNPAVDRLRIVSDAEQNLRANADSGATTTDAMLNRAATDPNLAIPPAVVAAAYTQNFAGTGTTRLLGIDIATGTLQVQAPPNDGVLTTVGPLDPAMTFGPTAGFDIAGGDDGLSLAVLQPTGAVQSTLYRVSTRTGAAVALGAVGPAGTAALRGLAIRLQ